MDRKEIAEGIYASDQPSEPELRTLTDQGIRSIINLRTGDSSAALSPAQEAQLAEQAGVAYLNLPMNASSARRDDLDRLRENLASMPKPVLVHSLEGRRSIALTVAVVSPDQGANGTRAIKRVREMGVDIDKSGMADIIRQYADERRGTTAESRTAAVEAREPRSGVPPGGDPPRTQTK